VTVQVLVHEIVGGESDALALCRGEEREDAKKRGEAEGKEEVSVNAVAHQSINSIVY
jgi:hypothetical protein